MKIRTSAFVTAFTTVLAIVVRVISAWSRISGQFGTAFMDAFNSVHPHPYLATNAGLTTLEHCFGTGLDLFYVVVDSVIFFLAVAYLYNRLVERATN